MSADRSKPRLIVISQVVSDGFVRWLRDYSSTCGPVELYTGTACDPAGASIRVRSLPRYDRSSKGSRLSAWLLFTLAASWHLLFAPRGVPVLAITNPPLLPLLLVVFHLMFGRKFAIIEYDIYPQVMVAMGLIRPNGVIYAVWRRWHRWALVRAEVVIAISDVMADELRTMAGSRAVNLVTIPTWTDTTRIQPVPRDQNPFTASLGLKDELSVIYSGNLGETHAIETIVEVAERLRSRPDIRFVIVGEGAKRRLVEDAIASGQTPNITLLPPQSADVFPKWLASADLAFVTLAAGYERLSLPSKTYDMMAAGCAIIGVSPASSGLARVLADHDCGRNFSPVQSSDISAWLTELVTDRAALDTMSANSRKAAVEHFSAAQCEPEMTCVVRQAFALTNGCPEPTPPHSDAKYR